MQAVKILAIIVIISLCSSQVLSISPKIESNFSNKELPDSHVIENVPYFSQTEGYFCYYASIAMIFSHMGLNTDLEEIIFLDGIGYTHSYIRSEKIIKSTHYASLDFVFNLFGVEETWWYPNRTLSDEQRWNLFFSNLKENISNNKPAITRVDPFSMGSLRDQFIISDSLWNALFPPSHHLIVIVGYDEINQSICYHDPNAGYYGDGSFGSYAWIDITDFQKAVRLGTWSDYLLTTFIQTSDSFSKEERFEQAFKLNIEKIKGNYQSNQSLFGINASKELKKAFSDEQRVKTIKIYKKLEDAGFSYILYETLQKLTKILFSNKANIFDIFMVGKRIPFETTSNIIKQIAEFLENNNFHQDLCTNQSSFLKQESVLWAKFSNYFKVFKRKGKLISDFQANIIINKMENVLDEIIIIQQQIIDDGQDYF